MKGWVLAGGRSSRFGSDKAAHPIDGVPMVVRVARSMRDAGLEVCVIARDRRLEHLWPVVVEQDGPRHPLNGLVEGLRRGGGVFAPCDLPFFPPQGYRRLMEGVVADTTPLLGFYDATWLDRARRFLAAEDSVRRFASPEARETFPEEWLRNVNRTSDLSQGEE